MATFMTEIIPKGCLIVCISEFSDIDFFFSLATLDNKTQREETRHICRKQAKNHMGL